MGLVLGGLFKATSFSNSGSKFVYDLCSRVAPTSFQIICTQKTVYPGYQRSFEGVEKDVARKDVVSKRRCLVTQKKTCTNDEPLLPSEAQSLTSPRVDKYPHAKAGGPHD